MPQRKRDANVAPTLRMVQVCCSNCGFGAVVIVDAGDVVSHDAISTRGNNHAARQRRMCIQIIILSRQLSLHAEVGTATQVVGSAPTRGANSIVLRFSKAMRAIAIFLFRFAAVHTALPDTPSTMVAW